MTTDYEGRHVRPLTYWEKMARSQDGEAYLRWCAEEGRDSLDPGTPQDFLDQYQFGVEVPVGENFQTIIDGTNPGPPRHRA